MKIYEYTTVISVSEIKEVVYSDEHWKLLHRLRVEAKEVMSKLEEVGLYSIVHGSIARGDVKPSSDIDVFIPNPPAIPVLEALLEKANFPILSKYIVQPTPVYSPKAYVEIGESKTLSFPLAKLSPREIEFYKFSGQLDLRGLKSRARVCGVNKRLVFIEPTERGHKELSIFGREQEVAKKLEIDIQTVYERERVLTRRRERGRTGLFLKIDVPPDKSLSEALEQLAKRSKKFSRRY